MAVTILLSSLLSFDTLVVLYWWITCESSVGYRSWLCGAHVALHFVVDFAGHYFLTSSWSSGTVHSSTVALWLSSFSSFSVLMSDAHCSACTLTCLITMDSPGSQLSFLWSWQKASGWCLADLMLCETIARTLSLKVLSSKFRSTLWRPWWVASWLTASALCRSLL